MQQGLKMKKAHNAVNSKKKRITLAVMTGLGLAAGFILILQTIWQNNMAPGPMNSGHETLTCPQCHIKAQGSLRQKIQANIGYLIGTRLKGVYLGYQPVGNKDCVDCHHRPKDRHPVYRFMEPKYREVRQSIQAHRCIACHGEHQGTRVTVSVDMCSQCHKKLILKNDPLEISHESLIKKKRWGSCLRCHDFHGNYKYKAPTKVKNAISHRRIREYLNGGPSPYGEDKHYKARKKRND